LRCSEGIETVVHLAASTGVPASVENPVFDMENNVIGTFNMLDAARQNAVKKFIFASSGASIGECAPPIHEEMIPHPVSPYGASKLAGEGYCSAYYHIFGIDTAVLRFSNVYGPSSNHKNSVVAKFIRQAIKGETLEIYGDGRQTRDFIYIQDLIEAIILAVKIDCAGGETFQIATSIETTLGKLTDELIPILNKSGIRNIEVFHSFPRPGDVLRNYSDTSKAREMLGWKARVNLTNGLRHTVDWFMKLELSTKPI
jgi:UDP-glucose 4-epimerase